MPTCDRSGHYFETPSDGIYDDGEWISWEWINEYLDDQDTGDGQPSVEASIADLFRGLINIAHEYRVHTGRYLQIWGELGELYAEVKHGLRRHRAHAQGSDGRLGNDLIEVKTISPEKAEPIVQVKLTGNFNKLLVVRISAKFEFESRLVDRRAIGQGSGTVASIDWRTLPKANTTR